MGWMTAGPLGALAGIVLGKVFDSMMNSVNSPETRRFLGMDDSWTAGGLGWYCVGQSVRLDDELGEQPGNSGTF